MTRTEVNAPAISQLACELHTFSDRLLVVTEKNIQFEDFKAQGKSKVTVAVPPLGNMYVIQSLRFDLFLGPCVA